jgi:hypothetical protein
MGQEVNFYCGASVFTSTLIKNYNSDSTTRTIRPTRLDFEWDFAMTLMDAVLPIYKKRDERIDYLLDLGFDENSIVLKTNYAQQKTLGVEEKTFIISEVFPYTVVCEKVIHVGYKQQSVEFQDIHFIETSPVLRQHRRVIPDENHTVTLFIENNKAQKNAKIEDISISAVKLKLDKLSENVKEGDKAVLDMVLTLNKNPLIINTKATVFRKRVIDKHYELVLVYELPEEKKRILVEYITKKLMLVIREFKKMQNE